MKRWIKWIVALAVLAAIGFSVMKALQGRKAQQEAVAAAAATNAKAQAVVEMAATDIVKAQTGELTQALPFTGTVKASNTAFVKARVPGDLQGLTLREGDAVKAGQIIARVEVTEYAARQQQAQDQADAAKAQIVIAQRQFDNNKALVEQGFISKTALDTSVATLNAAQATYRATVANVDLTKKAVQDTVLRSPLTGIVSQRLVQPGERVGVDTRVLEVIDLSRMEVEASLSAADSLNVSVGQLATLKLEGRPTPLSSQVTRINPNAQAGSRNVLVYLTLATAPGVRQGLFAEGSLTLGKVSALLVPLQTVRNDKPTPYVQVIENNVVTHRSVTTGKTGEVLVDGKPVTMVAINQGLAEGAQVVGGTVGLLREGTITKVSPSAAAK
jgi:membrane fusion protein, multidrug efflux system